MKGTIGDYLQIGITVAAILFFIGGALWTATGGLSTKVTGVIGSGGTTVGQTPTSTAP